MTKNKPTPHDYPKPTAPISPVFSRYSCLLKRQPPPQESILSTRSHLHVSSGRAAIALALEHAGIKAGDEVLVPAYHCESMVSPVRWRGAKPVFFKINGDTSINQQDIEQKITANTKAIITTHYFGFLQNLQSLREVCDSQNILLIEDCAHALFGSLNNGPVGSWGHYAIASSMKFFPVYDGGILASNSHDLSAISVSAPPTTFHAKAAFNIIENAIALKRLGLIGRIIDKLLLLKSALWAGLKKLTGKKNGAIASPKSSDGGYDLDENWIHKKVSQPSKLIIEHSDYQRICTLRRRNYIKLEQALSRLDGIRSLYSSLPEQAIPLVYPVYVAEPDKHFAPLKMQGVPIWRFGEFLDSEINESVCGNSVELSAHIFQFPCHQELTQEELDWMIETITHEFTDTNGNSR